MRRLFVVLLVSLALGLVGQPVEAAVKPSVSISTSASAVTAGSSVTVKGAVSKNSQGAQITLQRKYGSGKWKTLGFTKVGPEKTYFFSVKALEGAYKFRAVVLKTKKIKKAISKTVTVVGNRTPVAVRAVTPGTVTVRGTASVGGVLSTDEGSWTPVNTEFTYQWMRNGQAIAGATGWDYRITKYDVGYAISVRVTGKASGYTTATATSTSIVASWAQFEVEADPSVVGNPKMGMWLTANRGEWAPDPDTFKFQWLRNGSVIGGATEQIYQLVDADVGKRISVQVTASLDGYQTATRTSAQTAVIIRQEFTTVPTPTISGATRSGQVLSASHGSWAPQPDSLTYQWLRDGWEVPGATGLTYRLTSSDVGSTISFRTVGTKTNYATTTATSASTATVTQPTQQEVVARILEDTNAFRAQNGKAALVLNTAMNTVAYNYSKKMYDECIFEHNPNYTTQIPGGWMRAGENIAAGQDYTNVVQAWIDSPGHRANLLGDFNTIGIGFYSGSNCYGTYFTQNFAKY